MSATIDVGRHRIVDAPPMASSLIIVVQSCRQWLWHAYQAALPCGTEYLPKSGFSYLLPNFPPNVAVVVFLRSGCL